MTTATKDPLAAVLGASLAVAAADAAPKGRVSNRFTKGTAVYACRSCGRKTRDTGRGDNEGVRMCVDCYELAGIDNHLSDTGSLGDQAPAAREYMTALRLNGKDPEALFPEVAKALEGTTPEQALAAAVAKHSADIGQELAATPTSVISGAVVPASTEPEGRAYVVYAEGTWGEMMAVVYAFSNADAKRLTRATLRNGGMDCTYVFARHC